MANNHTIRDYVTLQRGLTYKGSLVGQPGPALLGLGSIQPGGGFRESDYKTYGGECPPHLMLFPGDLFVSLKGATKDNEMIGSVARVPVSVPTGRLTQDTVGLKFLEPDLVIESFLYWILRTPQYRHYCAGRATGSAVVALSREDFLDFPVPEFSATQKQLVRLLDNIEKKIALNRRMNETLESMAQALFKSWFIDFDPVRAKAVGRKPASLDSATAARFPSAFQNSPLGEIPSGWNTAPLSDHVEAIKGLSYKGSGLAESGLPLHNLNSVYEGGGYKFVGIKRYTGEYRDRHLIHPGDVIVANTEQGHDCLLLGYAAVVPSTFGQPALYTHHLYRLRILPESPLTADYLCRLLNSPRMHDVVGGYGNGTTVNMLPIDGLQQPIVVVPPMKLIEKFTAIAGEARARCERFVTENEQLAAARDALLPKLLSGKLVSG